MAKGIPRSLASLKRELSTDETARWRAWYNNLVHNDKVNVGRVLRTAYQWHADARDSYSPHCKDDYFLMNAIGSTVVGKPEYGDVDLLLVTNRIWRDMDCIHELEDRLRGMFGVSLHPDVKDAYRSVGGRPDRAVIDLQPHQQGRPLQLTVQPETKSEVYFDHHEKEKFDGKPRVVLYRYGNTAGFVPASFGDAMHSLQTYFEGVALMDEAAKKFADAKRISYDAAVR